MTGVIIAVVAVGVLLWITCLSIHDRLKRIVALLEAANTMTHENRTGEWRDRY